MSEPAISKLSLQDRFSGLYQQGREELNLCRRRSLIFAIRSLAALILTGKGPAEPGRPESKRPERG